MVNLALAKRRTGLPIWERLKSVSSQRETAKKVQCARDLALAASFVRSLETSDGKVDEELRELARDLERIAGRLEMAGSSKAA